MQRGIAASRIAGAEDDRRQKEQEELDSAQVKSSTEAGAEATRRQAEEDAAEQAFVRQSIVDEEEATRRRNEGKQWVPEKMARREREAEEAALARQEKEDIQRALLQSVFDAEQEDHQCAEEEDHQCVMAVRMKYRLLKAEAKAFRASVEQSQNAAREDSPRSLAPEASVSDNVEM